MIIKVVQIVLGVLSILLSFYSFLGFVRLSRFWSQIPNLQRYEELFTYIAVFLGAFIGDLILIVMMVVK